MPVKLYVNTNDLYKSRLDKRGNRVRINQLIEVLKQAYGNEPEVVRTDFIEAGNGFSGIEEVALEINGEVGPKSYFGILDHIEFGGRISSQELNRIFGRVQCEF